MKKIMYSVTQMESAIEFIMKNNKFASSFTREGLRKDIFRWIDNALKYDDVLWTGSAGITVQFQREEEWDTIYAEILVDPGVGDIGDSKYVTYEAIE